jgi:cytochrome c oxidase subunit 1
MDMPNPVWLQNISQFASFGIAFPSGLTIMTIMMYIFRSRIKWNITSLFILAGVAGWAFGGFAGVETGWWGADVYLHNTLNIVGHIHLVILMGSVLMGLGLIYAVLPDLVIKRRMNRELGMLHLFLTLIGGFGLALMFLFLGMAGFVRREAAIPPEFAWSMPWLMFFALTVGFAQLIFAYNLFKSLLRRHAVAAHEVEGAQGREANAEKEDLHAPYRWGDSVA